MKYEEAIAAQMKAKADESRSQFHGNQYREVVSGSNEPHTTKRKELAKIAGTSEGIYFPYGIRGRVNSHRLWHSWQSSFLFPVGFACYCDINAITGGVIFSFFTVTPMPYI